jgi:hypothetical protein
MEFSENILSSGELTKKCSFCGDIKPVSEFFKSKSSKDGYQYVCKVCSRERRKLYINRLKDKGLCTWCGKESPVDGLSFCPGCAAKHSDVVKKSKLRRKAKGMCYLCNELVMPGHVYCSYHREYQRRYTNKRTLKFIIRVGNYFDNKCRICDLHSEHYEIFDAHHLDPSQKRYDISKMRSKDWELEVIPELEKCVYLCKICHARLHAGRFDEDLDSGKLILITGKVEQPPKLKVVGE